MIGQILCANPFLSVYDDFLTAADVDHCLALGQTGLERDTVGSPSGRGENDGRTNSARQLDQWADPVLTRIIERMSAILRLPPEHTEPAKILHYIGDQKFDLHIDAWNDYTPGHIEERRNGGQRLFTALCYLNDTDGGETVYPRLGVAVKPKKGRLCIGGHTLAGSDHPHPDSAHTGTSVASGEKWVLAIRWTAEPYVVKRSYPPHSGDLTTY